jgi:hypothetical protein
MAGDLPSTVGPVRPGNPRPGNAAPTDQSAAAETVSDSEDIGAGGPAADVQPEARDTGAAHPADPEAGHAEPPEDRPGPGETADAPGGAGGADGSPDAAEPDAPAGAVGLEGPGGAAEPDGPAGAVEADGPAGVAEPDGPAGAVGLEGPGGPAEADGPAVAAEPDGPAGAAEPDGPAGAVGLEGLGGAAEADGPGGVAEAEGPAGAAEADGSAGAAEPDGSAGVAEAEGPAGVAEADGPVGPDAVGGRPGAPAPPGRRLGKAVRRSARLPLPAASQARLRLRRADRQRASADEAAAAFARVTVLPAILMVAWLLVGLPLLLAGVFLPAPTLLVTVPLAVVLVAGLRRVPVRWPRALPRAAAPERAAPRRESSWPTWLGLIGTLVVAAGFTLWQFLFNSENVIVLRDPGAYLQTGYWLAQHGSLPISDAIAAFGGAHPGLAFSSTGFLASGTAVVPGLLSGLPLLLAGAFWVHGTAAAAAMGPILGGLAVLAFGGLAGRLAGPQWAPAAALVLAFTLPEQYTSRGLFSQTAAQVLLFGGLSLVADALVLVGPPGPARRSRMPAPQSALMALGGLALGLTSLVQVDGLLDVLPVIPFLGILVARKTKMVVPFAIGLAIGAGYGIADAYLLARPFMATLRPMPELIGLIAAWLAAMTVAGVELLRLTGFAAALRPVLARRPVRWLPDLAAALAGAVLIGLLIRPYLQTVRGPATGAAAAFVASLQRLEHLHVDPGRLYAEDTLYWVIWYVGLPAVLLGWLGLALLLRRCARALLAGHEPTGATRAWLLPLAVICCGGAAVLWQPETSPDQPWASRRLVPLVLPGVILCATWAAAWLQARARSRGAGNGAVSVVAAFCVAALLVPTVATTLGLGLSHTGHAGALRLTADGLALKRTGPGQVGAVTRLCSSLGPAASVVIVDRTVAAEFTQVIRGMCGDPTGSMAGQPAGRVQGVVAGIEHAGRRPVLLGASASELYAYGGGSPLRVLDLVTSQDPHTLTQPPTALWPAHYVIWMSSFGSDVSRA